MKFLAVLLSVLLPVSAFSYNATEEFWKDVHNGYCPYEYDVLEKTEIGIPLGEVIDRQITALLMMAYFRYRDGLDPEPMLECIDELLDFYFMELDPLDIHQDLHLEGWGTGG